MSTDSTTFVRVAGGALSLESPADWQVQTLDTLIGPPPTAADPRLAGTGVGTGARAVQPTVVVSSQPWADGDVETFVDLQVTVHRRTAPNFRLLEAPPCTIAGEAAVVRRYSFTNPDGIDLIGTQVVAASKTRLIAIGITALPGDVDGIVAEWLRRLASAEWTRDAGT